eukprot:TRINITY_DN38040_c0_g1_i1.p1 TRINITY_DN38040_c0_g1~~TRINITY_DN38040_c0_g1_i1.p1  ORF type:complete len:1046 (-),score=165.21 TRINITY_DN38040_c0_g1_i1:8-3145(-)
MLCQSIRRAACSCCRGGGCGCGRTSHGAGLRRGRAAAPLACKHYGFSSDVRKDRVSHTGVDKFAGGRGTVSNLIPAGARPPGARSPRHSHRLGSIVTDQPPSSKTSTTKEQLLLLGELSAEAREHLRASRLFGVAGATTHDARDFTTAIGMLTRRGLAADALLLHEEMRRRGLGHGHTVTYNIAMTACARTQQWPRAVSLLREMCLTGSVQRRFVEPDSMTFGAAIGACIDARKHELCLELVTEMRERELKPDAVACTAAVEACRQLHWWAEATDMLRLLRQIGLPQTLALLTGEARGSPWGGRGVARPAEYGTAVITTLSRRSFWSESLVVFEHGLRKEHSTIGASAASRSRPQQAEAPNEMLDVMTYNAALAACQRGRQTDMALAILSDMRRIDQHGHNFGGPDLVSFNTAIGACDGSAWVQAVALFDQLHECNLRADAMTVASLVGACVRGGAWERAHAIFLWAIGGHTGHGSLNLESDMLSAVALFNASISASERGPGTGSSINLFEQLLRRRLRPDAATFNLTISACKRSQDWGQALSLLRRMPQAGVTVSTATYNLAIDACSHVSQWQLATELFDKLPTLRLRPSQGTYAILIRAYEHPKLWPRALTVLAEMRSERVRVGIGAYSTAIEACASGTAWQQAVGLLREAQGTWLSADHVAFLSAINACENAGRWQEALLLLDDVRGSVTAKTRSRLSVSPVKLFNVTISALEKGNQWQRALALLGDMHSDRVEPDAVSFQAVILSLCGAGRYATARKLWDDAVQRHLIRVWRSHGPFGSQQTELDLHGLAVEVAKIAVEAALDKLAKDLAADRPFESDSISEARRKLSAPLLTIVTGRGLHSPDGEAVVRRAVLDLLAWHPQFEGNSVPGNPGAVAVVERQEGMMEASPLGSKDLVPGLPQASCREFAVASTANEAAAIAGDDVPTDGGGGENRLCEMLAQTKDSLVSVTVSCTEVAARSSMVNFANITSETAVGQIADVAPSTVETSTAPTPVAAVDDSATQHLGHCGRTGLDDGSVDSDGVILRIGRPRSSVKMTIEKT